MGNIKKKTDPIDIYVGSRIRFRRNFLGLSQEKLGEQLGITFQQIQKYEKGMNRVGASRLQAISEILKVPISFFFEEHETLKVANDFDENNLSYVDFCSSVEGLQLMRAFTHIKDPKVRRKIIDLAQALSNKNMDVMK